MSYKNKEAEPIQSVQLNTYQSNAYRKDSDWLHFKDEQRYQEMQV